MDEESDERSLFKNGFTASGELRERKSISNLFTFKVFSLFTFGALLLLISISIYDALDVNSKELEMTVLDGNLFFEDVRADVKVMTVSDFKVKSIMHSYSLRKSMCYLSYSSRSHEFKHFGSLSVQIQQRPDSLSVTTGDLHVSRFDLIRQIAWDVGYKFNPDASIHIRCSSDTTFWVWNAIPIQINGMDNSFDFNYAKSLQFVSEAVQQELKKAQPNEYFFKPFKNFNPSWEKVQLTLQNKIAFNLKTAIEQLKSFKVHIPKVAYEIACNHAMKDGWYFEIDSFEFDLAKETNNLGTKLSLECLRGIDDKPCTLGAPLLFAPKTFQEFEQYQHINISAVSERRNFFTSLIGYNYHHNYHHYQ